ncbi:hypothetical protein H2O73_12865 [Vibrio sp. 404]|uniref:TFIIB-type domain-containing protein n=1 Tax=Vibrio marinisediminis TaxID=2758441 RepID=A0A7W2FS75_9VIBR|nr:hypothetical protein [Vibrio marinisediminis]
MENVDHCPLCNCDEFLISNSGSLLCAGCGSLFEDVQQIVATETLHPASIAPITITQSMLSH